MSDASNRSTGPRLLQNQFDRARAMPQTAVQSAESETLVNRYAVMLTPRQPAVEWLNRIFPGGSRMTLEEIQQERDIFLVAQETIETPEEAQRWVHQQWDVFFDRFLAEWSSDEAGWPQARTLDLFRDWFDVEFHSMVWDFGDIPLDSRSLD